MWLHACYFLTVVFLLKESPELVGSLLWCVLILWELDLLLFRDQLKNGLREVMDNIMSLTQIMYGTSAQHMNKCEQARSVKPAGQVRKDAVLLICADQASDPKQLGRTLLSYI